MSGSKSTAIPVMNSSFSPALHAWRNPHTSRYASAGQSDNSTQPPLREYLRSNCRCRYLILYLDMYSFTTVFIVCANVICHILRALVRSFAAVSMGRLLSKAFLVSRLKNIVELYYILFSNKGSMVHREGRVALVHLSLALEAAKVEDRNPKILMIIK